MGRSHGPGSPVWFRCSKCRSTLNPDRRTGWDVELTGRQRKANFKHAPGSRSSFMDREYRCLSCGHVGWSNHVDLAEKAGESRYKGSSLERMNLPE
jgi:hypothetical protein